MNQESLFSISPHDGRYENAVSAIREIVDKEEILAQWVNSPYKERRITKFINEFSTKRLSYALKIIFKKM